MNKNDEVTIFCLLVRLLVRANDLNLFAAFLPQKHRETNRERMLHFLSSWCFGEVRQQGRTKQIDRQTTGGMSHVENNLQQYASDLFLSVQLSQIR